MTENNEHTTSMKEYGDQQIMSKFLRKQVKHRRSLAAKIDENKRALSNHAKSVKSREESRSPTKNQTANVYHDRFTSVEVADSNDAAEHNGPTMSQELTDTNANGPITATF